jgi:aromatic ring-opening dioxygenase catalytic subunit (LigB family)
VNILDLKKVAVYEWLNNSLKNGNDLRDAHPEYLAGLIVATGLFSHRLSGISREEAVEISKEWQGQVHIAS